MPKKLETITFNHNLIKQGFRPLATAPDAMLPEVLTPIMIEYARGMYDRIRIVPGDLALEGSGFRFIEPSHIIYARNNRGYIETKGHVIRVVQPFLEDENTGETKHVPLTGL